MLLLRSLVLFFFFMSSYFVEIASPSRSIQIDLSLSFFFRIWKYILISLLVMLVLKKILSYLILVNFFFFFLIQSSWPKFYINSYKLLDSTLQTTHFFYGA